MRLSIGLSALHVGGLQAGLTNRKVGEVASSNMINKDIGDISKLRPARRICGIILAESSIKRMKNVAKRTDLPWRGTAFRNALAQPQGAGAKPFIPMPHINCLIVGWSLEAACWA